MKLVILVDSVFSERDYIRFGVENMIAKGMEVCLWDFSKIRENSICIDGFVDNSYNVSRRIFNNKRDIDQAIPELKEVFLIDYRSGIYNLYDKKWFQKLGAKIIMLDQGLLPASYWSPSMSEYISIFRHQIVNLSISAVFRKFLKLFRSSLFKDQDNHFQYDIKVCSGSVSKCGDREYEIRSHAFDYDTYLNLLNDNNYKTFNQIVFVDSNVTNHSDFIELGLTPYCTKDRYYKSINSFFDFVENALHMPVIIAPHPRTKDSSNLINLYNNRKVSNCSTAELVRGCNIVMSHVSTSINFAVLWKKPLLILSTNEIERSLYFAIESICRLLEVNRINVDKYDKGVNLLQHANLPIKNYSKYKKYLIKTESSPDEKSSDILIKGLEKYVQ
jgi:hypothetical protein